MYLHQTWLFSLGNAFILTRVCTELPASFSARPSARPPARPSARPSIRPPVRPPADSVVLPFVRSRAALSPVDPPAVPPADPPADPTADPPADPASRPPAGHRRHPSPINCSTDADLLDFDRSAGRSRANTQRTGNVDLFLGRLIVRSFIRSFVRSVGRSVG